MTYELRWSEASRIFEDLDVMRRAVGAEIVTCRVCLDVRDGLEDLKGRFRSLRSG